MIKLIDLIAVGALFGLLLLTFLLLTLVRMHKWWLDRRVRGIRRRQVKLRMLREYRSGHIK